MRQTEGATGMGNAMRGSIRIRTIEAEHGAVEVPVLNNGRARLRELLRAPEALWSLFKGAQQGENKCGMVFVSKQVLN